MRTFATLLIAALAVAACDTVTLEEAEPAPRAVWVNGEYVGYSTVNGRAFRHVFVLHGNPYDRSITGSLTLDISGDQEWSFDVRGTQAGDGVDLSIGVGWSAEYQVLHLFGTADSTATVISGEMRWDNGLGDYDDYSVTVTKREPTARGR